MDAATTPVTIVPLTQLGDPLAVSCDGDFCEIPAHHEQAVVNRKLDLDEI